MQRRCNPQKFDSTSVTIRNTTFRAILSSRFTKPIDRG